MAILTKLKAQSIKPDDNPVADGTVSGLWLHPGNKKGRGKWLLRYKSPTEFIKNKDKTIKHPPRLARREMGFGAYPEVIIDEARKSASAARALLREGIDPIDARKSDTLARRHDAQAPIFENAARQVHAALKPGWQNPRHAANWIKSLEMYVFPRIGSRNETAGVIIHH